MPCDVLDLTSNDCVPIVRVAVATFASVAAKDEATAPFRNAPPPGEVRTAVGGVLSRCTPPGISYYLPAPSPALNWGLAAPRPAERAPRRWLACPLQPHCRPPR